MVSILHVRYRDGCIWYAIVYHCIHRNRNAILCQNLQDAVGGWQNVVSFFLLGFSISIFVVFLFFFSYLYFCCFCCCSTTIVALAFIVICFVIIYYAVIVAEIGRHKILVYVISCISLRICNLAWLGLRYRYRYNMNSLLAALLLLLLCTFA